MFIWTCVLFWTVSEIEIFEFTTAKLLIRKRYYVYVLFLITVFIVQVTGLVQFIVNVLKFHRQHQCTLQLVWRHAYCSSESVLTFVYAGDNIQYVNEQFVSCIHLFFFSVHFTLSINVWRGMIDDMLIGPVILDDRMTGLNYLDFLQNELPKQLEDVPLATRIAMYFQHDGAPSHYTRHVMQHLNDTSPNRWIGRGSTINWPPRSPELNPLDFCLWGLMKSEVYRKKWIHETNCSLTYRMLSPA